MMIDEDAMRAGIAMYAALAIEYLALGPDDADALASSSPQGG